MNYISLWGPRLFLGWEGVHSTRPSVRLVRMEYHSFHWYSIGEMHIIMGSYNISVGASGWNGGGGAFYSSFGTIGTNGISFIPLVIHWGNAYHYGDIDNFLGASGWEGVHSIRPLLRLVRMEYHSFQW